MAPVSLPRFSQEMEPTLAMALHSPFEGVPKCVNAHDVLIAQLE